MRNFMQRRTMLAAAALAAVTFSGCATLGRAGFKEPIVSFKDLRVRGLGLTGGRLGGDLTRFHPKGFLLGARPPTYNVKGGGKPLGPRAPQSRLTAEEQ